MMDPVDAVAFEDVTVGNEGDPVVEPDLAHEDFVRFAGATGDFNPMHYDDPAAREAGHPGVFGPGMLAGGFCSRFVANWFGIEQVTSFSVRFTDRVWPGDTVTVTGTVTDTEREGDRGVVEVSFEATTQDDVTVVTGRATASLPVRDA